MDFSKYSLPELTGSLSLLRQYKTMLRQAWKKGTVIFQERQSTVTMYRVEYAPWIHMDFLEKEALRVIQKTFHTDATLGDCVFIENTALISGMRIFSGDDMIDLSFQHLEKALQSITF